MLLHETERLAVDLVLDAVLLRELLVIGLRGRARTERKGDGQFIIRLPALNRYARNGDTVGAYQSTITSTGRASPGRIDLHVRRDVFIVPGNHATLTCTTFVSFSMLFSSGTIRST